MNLYSYISVNVQRTLRQAIYTKKITKQLELDLDKHNSQYAPILIRELSESHDRFLIIDRNELYHIGASLKDLGKKWFAFSKLNEFLPEILKKLDKDWYNTQKKSFESEYIKFMELHRFEDMKLCDE